MGGEERQRECLELATINLAAIMPIFDTLYRHKRGETLTERRSPTTSLCQTVIRPTHLGDALSERALVSRRAERVSETANRVDTSFVYR